MEDWQEIISNGANASDPEWPWKLFTSYRAFQVQFLEHLYSILQDFKWHSVSCHSSAYCTIKYTYASIIITRNALILQITQLVTVKEPLLKHQNTCCIASQGNNYYRVVKFLPQSEKPLSCTEKNRPSKNSFCTIGKNWFFYQLVKNSQPKLFFAIAQQVRSIVQECDCC